MSDVRKRGRRADPSNVRLALKRRYGNASFDRFADLVETKRWTTAAGGARTRLPRRSAVLRFCRGDNTDMTTWGPLCDEIGLPFQLLEKGHRLVAADFDDATFKRDWRFCHPASYTGKVWIRVVPRFENRALRHEYVIRWGPWTYRNILKFGYMESASLSHMKGDDGLSIPIIFDIEPPCFVAIGQGEPPGELVHDINHGWTRAD
jgi:hypothetical protein